MVFKKRSTTTSSGGTSKRTKFEYRARTAQEVQNRAHQSGGGKEGFVKSEINVFTPADGDNRIRILPPTWEDANHFGFEAFAHYQIGPDKSAFLCLSKNRSQEAGGAKPDDIGDDCPLCNARREADAEGDEELARALSWRKRVAMWVIDRAQESKGPLLWFAPWTLDQEIAKQSIGEDGEALPIDNPYEGYDVIFTREKGSPASPPKYTGVKIARRPSPVFDDEEDMDATLQFITDNPVPDQFVFQPEEAMRLAFEGKASAKGKKPEGEGGEEDEPKAKKPSGTSKFQTKGAKKPEKEEEEEEATELPSWDEVQEMDEEQLNALAEEAEVDFGDNEFDDLDAVREFICEALEIEKPKKKAGPKLAFKKAAKTEEEEEEEEEKPKAKKPSGPAPAAGGSWREKLAKFKK